MTDNILDGFILADPSNKDYFQANADSLKVDLAELNAAYQNELSVCAERNMVTAHDAFGYLAKRYGLNQISISGLSPVEEPSSRRLTEIAKFTKDNDIKYIFFESLVSRKFLEGLTQSELEQKKNYFTVMRNNLENLKIALQCKK
ncbi:MAG: Zinc-binding lipoprotein AdcA [Parcubacteria group bacterium GW2011_GWE2_38_18]|nr:MAG: Zinc-binding lipoprotein AdcA [Parcubacteria group bacterium GW2011_GWE2_38_18]